jgi:hypothetical protein
LSAAKLALSAAKPRSASSLSVHYLPINEHKQVQANKITALDSEPSFCKIHITTVMAFAMPNLRCTASS